MNLSEELKELQKLHESGFLTAEELERAKNGALGEESGSAVEFIPSESVGGSQVELNGLREKLERAELESDRALLANIESARKNAVGACFIAVLGLLWMITMSLFPSWSVFGWGSGLLVIAYALNMFVKSCREYREFRAVQELDASRRGKLPE